MTYNNEDTEFKSYDSQLIRRLLKYAKPYMHWLLLSIIMLVGVIGVELVQPILVGSAVDSIINSYDKTYSIVDKNADYDIHGIKLYKESSVDDGYKKAHIIYHDEKYYLVSDLDNEELKFIKKNKKEVEKLDIADEKIDINGTVHTAILLDEADLKLLRDDDFGKLKILTLIFLGVLVFQFFINYFQTLLLQFTGQKIIYNIRTEVFTHMQGLSTQFFNNNPVGKLVTRVTNDTETLNEMYTSVLVNSLKNIFLLIGIVVVMIRINLKLSLIVFTVIPLVVISTAIFRKYSRKMYREVRTHVAKINAFLSEHISGMKIIQIFAREDVVLKEFDQSNVKLRKAFIKQLNIFGVYRPLMYFFYIVSVCLVLGFGGDMVLKDIITIGTLIIFLQYVSTFFRPIQELAEQFNILQSAMAAAEKIFTLLDTKNDIKEKENPIVLKDTKGEIEFKNVWFAYEKEDWVLRDVSFTVNIGETVAFVGATGAGKTSILNLISRYYDIQKGEILLDGVNVKDIEIKSLRSKIGQMLQDVFLFTGDIKSNIRLREDTISLDAIKKSAIYVNADKFISKLPDKYDEKVYERGATLSAGQRQLLSFARTLVFDPSILILDEATANIDTETEQLIQDALQKIMKGRTTLVVAHRLSTIQHADKIIVLHKGKIREMGKHQELLSQKGIYYNLYQLQYKEQA